MLCRSLMQPPPHISAFHSPEAKWYRNAAVPVFHVVREGCTDLWHMKLHKGKALGNGIKSQVPIRENGRVKSKFPSWTPSSWEREKLCHLNCSSWDAYAPVNHCPVAPHARIFHPSEYPSTFCSLNTVIISPKDRQKGYFSAPSPYSLHSYLHESNGTYSVLWDTASI